MATRPLLPLLEQLEERLVDFGAPIVEHLQPGLPADEIRAALAADDLTAPAELVTWWSWHNGAGMGSQGDGPGFGQAPESVIFHTFHLGTLDASLRSRRWMRKLYDEELGWPDGYPSGWIPLLVSGRITLSFCVDALADEQVAPVYIYDHGGGTPHPPTPQFNSLAELIDLIVRIFDAGHVTHDPFDPRLPAVEYPPVSDDVRRLTSFESSHQGTS